MPESLEQLFFWEPSRIPEFQLRDSHMFLTPRRAGCACPWPAGLDSRGSALGGAQCALGPRVRAAAQAADEEPAGRLCPLVPCSGGGGGGGGGLSLPSHLWQEALECG